MRAIAETGGPASEADRFALASADRYIFGHDGPFSFDAVVPVAPGPLAETLAGTALGQDALKFLSVMAFMDGQLDEAKIGAVQVHAAALGLSESYLDDVAAAAGGRLQEALADMTRFNMESITGRPWTQPGGGA